MTEAAFITGIGGQDGSYLAERLLADGLEVHALVLVADGHPAHCPDEVVLHIGDLGDVDATRRLVREIAPREVYNLAARPFTWAVRSGSSHDCATELMAARL